MLTEENLSEIKENGYTVVCDVLTETECDHTIGQYRDWLSQFKDVEWPHSFKSLIQKYNTGHMDPTWVVRLKAKTVFAQIWKTDKLLTSVDAIAIGRPPEDGEEPFHDPGDHWLHHDQKAERIGLHAYQGSVFLEKADEDDWTLYVMEGSHRHFESFYDEASNVTKDTPTKNATYLTEENVSYFQTRGCHLKRVPVPKGGMVVWDSRLVHANASPIKGRNHPGRWRCCVFVSMTPAIWASETDMEKKREAYEKVCMTTHWSSSGVGFFEASIPEGYRQDIEYPRCLPDIAKTREAKLLSGVIPYDFEDGMPNGDELRPKWANSFVVNC